MTQPPDKTKQDEALRHADEGEGADLTTMHAPIMREQHDPRDGYEPIPLWLATLFGVLLFWGGYYLATYNGGFDANVLDEQPAARFALPSTGPVKPLDPMELGRRLFTANCVACHQANGMGVPGAYPPLNGSQWVLANPAWSKRIVLHGLEGPLQVKGESFNGAMPPFGHLLKDEQIAAVLSYVRNSWENKAGMIAPESVAATRKATAGRTRPFTAAEIMTVTTDEFHEASGAAAEYPTTSPATQPATKPGG